MYLCQSKLYRYIDIYRYIYIYIDRYRYRYIYIYIPKNVFNRRVTILAYGKRVLNTIIGRA